MQDFEKGGARNFRKFERNIDQNLKLSHSSFVPFFAQNQVKSKKKGLHSNFVPFSSNIRWFQAQSRMPNLQRGRHASILLTFLCNFAILANQRGGHGPMAPPNYAPDDTLIAQSSHYCTSVSNSGNQLFVLPSVARECNQKIPKLSTCFSVVPFVYNELLSGFPENWSTSVLTVLVFILAGLHVSAKLFNARWRPDSVEESRTK